jgi:hypothetical protein
MRSWIRLFGWVSVAWVTTSAGVFAQIGAKQSGNWNTGSTWTGGTAPSSSSTVYIGSTTPSGSATTATVYLGNGSGTSGTLDVAGNALTISGSLYIGQSGGAGTLNDGGGSFTAASAYVENGNSLTFGANDAVSSLNLSGGSSATTVAAGNITTANYTGSNIESGSTLTLGTNLNMNTGSLNVQDSGSTLNMAGHSITGNELFLGWYGTSAVTLAGRGALAVSNLYVGNGMAFNINAGDQVGTFSLSGGSSTLNANVAALDLYNGATATTTAAGGITTANYAGSNIESGSTLTLGTNLNMNTGSLNVQDSGSTLNAQGHALMADTLFAGWYGTSAVSVTDLGKMTLTDLYVGNTTVGSDLTFHGGDVINSLIDLRGGSILTVDQVGGTGLTLNGTSLSSLTIDPSSMDLIFNLNTAPNWDFRWADPTGGVNWISTIDAMIADHQILITAPSGYQVVDSDGYTYIMGGVSSVPEPSSLVLVTIATVGIAIAARWKQRLAGD